MIYVAKAVSKKTGNEYVYMYVELGYTRKALSFNVSDIAEILGISVVDLKAKVDKESPFCVGEIRG